MEAFDNGFRTGPYLKVRPGPEPVIERYRGPVVATCPTNGPVHPAEGRYMSGYEEWVARWAPGGPLLYEPDFFARGITEAIYIRALQPSLNRDEGCHRLSATYDPLLTESRVLSA
ncbi:hypothetical protein Bbelb_017180 [Branchiostoma belcheri]|nr:hypothetical protein Bbelb_017180 [Branchiostoma belcheri]